MKMYFIAIVLPAGANEKMLQLKHYMQEKYKCAVGLKSPAHITIVPPFWMREEREKDLFADVETISRQQELFCYNTNNFSAFKPRTIFVAIEENAELNALKIRVDEFLAPKNYGLKKEERPFHPHVTIATRDLHKKAFAEAWQMFEDKKFEESYEASGLSVLKHNGKNWDVVFSADFILSRLRQPAPGKY